MLSHGASILAGGATTVIGPVAVTGGTVDIYNTTNFNGLVTIASGTVTTHAAVATFSMGFALTWGSYLKDPSITRTTDLSVSAQSALGAGLGYLARRPRRRAGS
jgi:hypothetical protein